MNRVLKNVIPVVKYVLSVNIGRDMKHSILFTK
jgi:hypothetical protein